MSIDKTLEVVSKFDMDATVISCAPYGKGHINDTYLITTDTSKRYILQRINRKVFKAPDKVIQNIINVTEYLKGNLSNGMKTLTLVPCKNNKKYHIDTNCDYWRMYDFIENAISLELPETENDFYQSAVAFGSFQNMLKDFPAETLFETIPMFHNTPNRYKNFLEAVKIDPFDRVKTALPEIAFVKKREKFYDILENEFKSGRLPLKVTHNDTKLNNVMLDSNTRRPVCVIDLDTIMPGYSVNDFGDSIRFGASTAAEDEKDLDKVHFDIELYKIYTKGFLYGCQGILTDVEIELLPVGAIMMTIECGMRFLTDYLSGDVYFKTKYPEHNLVRARTQFKLVDEMENNFDEMKEIIAEYCR